VSRHGYNISFPIFNNTSDARLPNLTKTKSRWREKQSLKTIFYLNRFTSQRATKTWRRACSSRCCGLSSVVYHSWEGKCSETLAIPRYSKNPRANKDIWYIRYSESIISFKSFQFNNNYVWYEVLASDSPQNCLFSYNRTITSQSPAFDHLRLSRLIFSAASA